MSFELINLRDNIDRIQRIKMGEEKPDACGTCEYCRANQRITGVYKYERLVRW